MRYLLRAFLPMLILFLVLEVGSVAVFQLCSFCPWLADLLAFSPRSPWGLATSLFTHLNLEHLTYNLQGLLFYTCMATVLMLNTPLAEKGLRRLCWGYVAILMAPHMLILTVEPSFMGGDLKFFGMSLALYSLYGYTLLLGVFSLLSLGDAALKGEQYSPLSLALAAASFILLLALIPMTGGLEAFLGVGKPQTNAVGHAAALVLGLILGFAIIYWAARFK